MQDSVVFRARWLLPIDRPPIENGWIEVEHGQIIRTGSGSPPSPARELGDVALMPGFVNAHTHLELSWMAGLVPPAASMHEWIRTLLRVRRVGPAGGADAAWRAARDAAAAMRATGTVLVGDVSNTLLSPRVLADAGLGGVVFHELLGFNATDPAQLVRDALRRAAETESAVTDATPALRVTIAAHAPYSVSPALFREIAAHAGGPLTVHLAESPEEIEFLRRGLGPIRATLEELGVWDDGWEAPGCDPVQYLGDLGYLHRGVLTVHAVHLTDDGLDRLREADAVIVTCPRSNEWVGAGLPRVSHFYASGVHVAIGTDSLASAPTLNMFDELAELRRVAPDVTAASLLESATRVGARALGFGREYGTLRAGKRAAFVAVDVPSGVVDVEEFLVGGIAPDAIHPVAC